MILVFFGFHYVLINSLSDRNMIFPVYKNFRRLESALSLFARNSDVPKYQSRDFCGQEGRSTFWLASSNAKTNIPKTWVISKNFIHLKQVYFIRSKLEEHEF